ncbi:hypothetical protein MASR2M39_31250 [Ignavibacteriales bacterium]
MALLANYAHKKTTLYLVSTTEKLDIIAYAMEHPGEGYRRRHMVIDENVAFASPSTVYRVLKEAHPQPTQ